jgi:hypothetical protein
MIVVASREDAARTLRDYTSPHGAQAHVETYMGVNKATADLASHDAPDMPNAYLVSQLPGSALHPHFHQADQFQVFLGGSGRIGTHPIEPVTVHYASAHSPYGPVVAGPQGLQYLTLRRRWDPGAQWMPDSAQRLRAMGGRKHRVHTSDVVHPRADIAPPGGSCKVTSLFEDGSVGAWVVELGGGAAWENDGKADRFAYVLDGTVEIYGNSVKREGCLFANRDEPKLRLVAGGRCARLILVRFDDEPG